jgi:hypothetical protein
MVVSSRYRLRGLKSSSFGDCGRLLPRVVGVLDASVIVAGLERVLAIVT